MKTYRISADIDLPKDERRQAQNWNVYAGKNFKSHRAAVEALKTLPENHLFKVYEVIPAMSPF